MFKRSLIDILKICLFFLMAINPVKAVTVSNTIINQTGEESFCTAAIDGDDGCCARSVAASDFVIAKPAEESGGPLEGILKHQIHSGSDSGTDTPTDWMFSGIEVAGWQTKRHSMGSFADDVRPEDSVSQSPKDLSEDQKLLDVFPTTSQNDRFVVQMITIKEEDLNDNEEDEEIPEDLIVELELDEEEFEIIEEQTEEDEEDEKVLLPVIPAQPVAQALGQKAVNKAATAMSSDGTSQKDSSAPAASREAFESEKGSIKSSTSAGDSLKSDFGSSLSKLSQASVASSVSGNSEEDDDVDSQYGGKSTSDQFEQNDEQGSEKETDVGSMENDDDQDDEDDDEFEQDSEEEEEETSPSQTTEAPEDGKGDTSGSKDAKK